MIYSDINNIIKVINEKKVIEYNEFKNYINKNITSFKKK
jgi:hypothetical protein